MKRISRHVCQAIAVASALAMPLASRAESTSDGQSFKALSAQWWQWVLSVPTAANPLTDTSGANCMVGQRGPVWFLAGSFGGAASRRCSVPEGVPLFFPIVNNVQVNTPNICGQTAAITVAQMRAVIAPFIDGVTGLSVTLNSRAVTGIRRVQSDPFISALPVDNIFVGPCGGHP